MKALGCLLGFVLSVALFSFGLLLFAWQWIRRQLGIGTGFWPKQHAQSSQQQEEPKKEETKSGFFDDSEGEYVDYEEVKE